MFCTNLLEDLGVLWPVVVEYDAGTAGDEDHGQRDDDVDKGHEAVQVREALAVEVEQQRHHAQSQYGGAASHHNAEGKHR